MKKSHIAKKITAAALAGVMAVSLAACGKQDGGNQGTADQKEYVYVPEYLELDSDTNSNYNNLTVQGDKLYYINYQWDEENGESKITLGSYNLTDGSKEDLPVEVDSNNGGINSMQVDADGNIYTAEYQWNATEGDDAYAEQKTMLRKYDAAGTQILPQKEFQLLYKLASYPGRIFTRQQLMDDIWGVESETEARTVDVHINRLRDRFRDNPDFASADSATRR